MDRPRRRPLFVDRRFVQTGPTVQQQASPHDVELRHIDRKRNRFRVYALTTCRTLFGELALMITWGRIGSRLRVRCESFAEAAALVRRRDELLARRRRHGYVAPAR